MDDSDEHTVVNKGRERHAKLIARMSENDTHGQMARFDLLPLESRRAFANANHNHLIRPEHPEAHPKFIVMTIREADRRAAADYYRRAAQGFPLDEEDMP